MRATSDCAVGLTPRPSVHAIAASVAAPIGAHATRSCWCLVDGKYQSQNNARETSCKDNAVCQACYKLGGASRTAAGSCASCGGSEYQVRKPFSA